MKESIREDVVTREFEKRKEKSKRSIDDLNKFKKRCFLYAGNYWGKNLIVTKKSIEQVLEMKKTLKEKIAISSKDLAEVGYFSGLYDITLPSAKKPYKISREEYYPAIYKSYVDIIKKEEDALKGIIELGLEPVIFQK